jgi:hypothetical protein
MGQTKGTWPIRSATWSQPNGKQFIAKLQPDLSAYVYSTVFGKGESLPDLSPVAFLVDRCENVYISGWGGDIGGYPSAGVAGLPVTADAFKKTPDLDTKGIGQDFYFFVLKKDATAQLFGSFYGQNSNNNIPDHVDGGTSRFDKNGVIYQAICANCYGGGTFPTTPGVWAPTNPSGKCNLAMLKIDLDLSGVRGSIRPTINGVRDTAGCLPLKVMFTDTLAAAKSYQWLIEGTTYTRTADNNSIEHEFKTAGTFTIRLIAFDPEKCITTDTVYQDIKVSDIKAALNYTEIKLNPCDSYRYRFENTSTATPLGKIFLNQHLHGTLVMVHLSKQQNTILY